MFCHKCGNKVIDNAAYCSKCGAKLEQMSIAKENDELADIPTSAKTNTIQVNGTQKFGKIHIGIIGAVIVLIVIVILSIGKKDTPAEEEMSTVVTEVVVEVPELRTSKEAETNFERWLKTHPIEGDWGYELVDEHGDWGNGRESYMYALSINGGEYYLFIDREDGSMYIDNEMEVMAIDYWYESTHNNNNNREEDIYVSYENIDFELVGRWRAEDGGMLEFDELGNLLSCDFKCWSIYDNPDYLMWKAADGRVICESAFCYDKSYEISISEEDGKEKLRFDGYGDWYIRDEEVAGDGLVGRWKNEAWGVFACEFNADGSGQWNYKYPVLWYEYESENEGVITKRVEYTLWDSGSFDYHVNGDSLTVFMSDGSRTYIKVSN